MGTLREIVIDHLVGSVSGTRRIHSFISRFHPKDTSPDNALTITSDKLSKTDISKQFEAFLNQDDANVANSDSAKRQAQCDFWMEYREIIGVNQQSQSFAVFDKIAEAILEGKTKEAMEAFGTPVLLLPNPARMTALKQALDHPIFADHKRDSPPPSRDSSVKGSPKNSPPGTPPKDAPVKNTPKDSTPKGKQKKNTPKDSSLKGSRDKKRKTPSGATANTLFPHLLVDQTKVKVKNDLEEIYRTAQEAKKSVYELAYPWEDLFLWYDPAAFPSLHLAHWRIWMRNRPKFIDWQLHAPLLGKYIMGVRRKAEMDAIQERVELLDMCVAIWGYYGFLRMFEPPGRNSRDSRHYSGPTIANLSFALEPFQIDKEVFTTITELLELMGALNPSAGIDSRLGDRALARVYLDVCSKQDPDHADWAGDRLTGVWMTLIQCSRIKKLAVKVEKQLA
ncbi:hypothetical protein PHMEG_00035756, partial [Phytophthora megakarya]